MLPQAGRFNKVIADLEKALDLDDLLLTQTASKRLVDGLCLVFNVPHIHVHVLGKRPSTRSSELHGLYEAGEGKPTKISVWMRTAKKKQVVAFPTFLRTIIHEFLHHLDYEYFKLQHSFHTQGFYQRESRLTRDLKAKKRTTV